MEDRLLSIGSSVDVLQKAIADGHVRTLRDAINFAFHRGLDFGEGVHTIDVLMTLSSQGKLFIDPESGDITKILNK